MDKIVYLNAGFFDTDVTVVKQLANHFELHWFVILSPNGAYKHDFFEKFIDGTNIRLHLYTYTCRRRSLSMLKLYLKCLQKIRKIKPSLIYTCNQDFYFQISKHIFVNRTPEILGIHDVMLHSNFKAPIFLRISRWLSLHSADYFVQFSNNQHKLFKKLHPNKKSFLLGMSSKNFGQSNIEKPKDLDYQIKILFFGTIQSYKGYDLLIKTFERIIEEGTKNIMLSFYGKCASVTIEQDFNNLIKHRDFYNLNLEFIDNKDIPDIFSAHHFCVFPYRDATNSGPLMIAANYGIPIIAPNHSCFADVYTNGVNSILYQPEDKDGLYKVLKHITQIQIEEYNNLMNGCKTIQKNYSEEAIAKNYIKLFDNILH